ncbi:MAG: TIGR01244 family phosphatase [Rhodobacterales bacterium]|nr:TIGR01244 family phosphatase [Rhodobacterales bacterium]
MQINTLTPDYAVSGQIAPQDVAALKQAGFATIICNRPDAEVFGSEASAVIRAAAEDVGLSFIYNPVAGGAMTDENVAVQRTALAETDGPVFAYCRSGMRSAVVWALANAGSVSTGDLIAAAGRGGYDLSPLRGQIDAA